MQSGLFFAEKLLTLIAFACAFLGYGKLWSKILLFPRVEDAWLRICLYVAGGMGVFIIGMQIIGIAGLLKKDFVRALLIIGMALIFLKQAPTRILLSATATGKLCKQSTKWHDVAAALLFVTSLTVTFDKSLLPPVHWDDLMYQLPHVREWLSAKQITVNERLRYPYFPYNFNLLYAAIMSITNAQNSTLMHAFAGWLIALLLFRLARNNYGSLAAVLATAIWIASTNSLFETSYIELGLSLFILSAVVCFICWIQDKEKSPSLLIASAFFLGLAAGTKYQALIYPPFFIAAAFLHERRPAIWLRLLLAFLVPCILWYVRNFILAGNPINPLAGNIFGYHDWNAGDFFLQIQDLKRSQSYPPVEMWLALLVLASSAGWGQNQTRWMILLSIYSVIIWYFTSHYDRYLVPQYPVIALLSGLGVLYTLQILNAIGNYEKLAASFASPFAGKIILAVAFLIFTSIVIPVTIKKAKNIPKTTESINKYINARAQNFMLLHNLKIHHSKDKIYQLGLEGGLLYGPINIYGDHFGPWRYKDYENLSAYDLNKKLNAEGFSLLAANAHYSRQLEKKCDFQNYFSEIFSYNGDKAYLVLSSDD